MGQPHQCSEVMIGSNCSAYQAGSATSFVDDQECTVAQLFRGKSTRLSLEREPSEVLQAVTFMSPALSAGIAVSLDGIMLDSYDSGNIFDKARRHSNGKRPSAHCAFILSQRCQHRTEK